MKGFRIFQDFVTAVGYNCKFFERKTDIPFAAAQPKVSEGLHFLLLRAIE